MTAERSLTDNFTIGCSYRFQFDFSFATGWTEVVDIIPPSWVVVKEDSGAFEELINLNNVARVVGRHFNKAEREKEKGVIDGE